MNNNDVAIRKRTQIARANRTMFLWIAVASALVGAAIVVSIFLAQKVAYTERVLSKKQETVTNLDHNIAVVDSLKTKVKELEVNSALMSVKANESDEALQVVLDALPSEANSLALGASLQNKLLAGVVGNYSLKSLQVVPVNGVESLSADPTVVDAAAPVATTNTIDFTFAVQGDQSALRQVLQNLERSIRTIVVTRLSVDTQGGILTLSVDGHAFYQPVRSVQLTEEVVKAKE